jgi:hypothetical protein
MGMHMVHCGPVVTHRLASCAQPAGQQVCANAGDISAYAKARITSLRYPMPFSSLTTQTGTVRFVPEPPRNRPAAGASRIGRARRRAGLRSPLWGGARQSGWKRSVNQDERASPSDFSRNGGLSGVRSFLISSFMREVAFAPPNDPRPVPPEPAASAGWPRHPWSGRAQCRPSASRAAPFWAKSGFTLSRSGRW